MGFVSVVADNTKHKVTSALSVGFNWSCAVTKCCTNNVENGRQFEVAGELANTTHSIHQMSKLYRWNGEKDAQGFTSATNVLGTQLKAGAVVTGPNLKPDLLVCLR